MKQTTNNQKEDFDVASIENKPTPKYDAKGAELKKFVSAAGAKYIPELAEALRQDLFYNVDISYFRKDTSKASRDIIRDRIVSDWSKENGNLTPWTEETIKDYFPDWLKNPQYFKDVALEKLAKMRAAKAKKYQQRVQEQSRQMERLAVQLPEPPKELEPELIYPHEGMETWPSKYQKLGESTKSPLTKMGDIRDGCRELFTALTEKKYMPGDTEDLENDYIKPTREYRKFIHELDERERAGLYNWLVITQTAIADMLNIIDEADGKKE
jgi:hypothetical protein